MDKASVFLDAPDLNTQPQLNPIELISFALQAFLEDDLLEIMEVAPTRRHRFFQQFAKVLMQVNRHKPVLYHTECNTAAAVVYGPQLNKVRGMVESPAF